MLHREVVRGEMHTTQLDLSHSNQNQRQMAKYDNFPEPIASLVGIHTHRCHLRTLVLPPTLAQQHLQPVSFNFSTVCGYDYYNCI